jgi:hypothetical protein
LVPPPKCVLIGLKIEKRKPVGAIAQEGSQKSLSLGDSSHYHSWVLLKELRENRKNSNRDKSTEERSERSNEFWGRQNVILLNIHTNVKTTACLLSKLSQVLEVDDIFTF